MISLKSKPNRSILRILIFSFILLFTMAPIVSASAPEPVTNLHFTNYNFPSSRTIEWTNPTSAYDNIRIILVDRTTLTEVFRTNVSPGTTTYVDSHYLNSSKRYMYTVNTSLNGVYSSYASMSFN